MSYHLLTYSLLFLPAVILIYQIIPQKYRWIFTLFVNYTFFFMISGWLIVYLLATTVISYLIGQRIAGAKEKTGLKGKELTKYKKKIEFVGVMINLIALAMLKYLRVFGIGTTWLVPIGISYYTLQAISYMTDIQRGTLTFEKNPAKLALYLSYFPQIMEGPISRYSEVADGLYEGKRITYENLTLGYQRIVWGLFKKMLIADRFAPMVSRVFRSYEGMDGSAIFLGAVAFTIQLYMEFSGCMDIVLGTGQIFGIKLPENFRQPFFAKDASDFWRRWHITLGTWLKDYIFFPVSLSKPVKNLTKKFKNNGQINVSKFTGPTIALFFVWLGNGVWHGPRTNYLFYGMYYFVIIFLENILEEPSKKLTERLKINREKAYFKALQIIKLLFIVIMGEMFFRADSVGAGFRMFGKIMTSFHITMLRETNFSVDSYDLACAIIFTIVVFIVDIIKEKGIDIREKITGFKLPVRWIIWYAMIILIVIFGAYGKGYTMVDMIYAAY